VSQLVVAPEEELELVPELEPPVLPAPADPVELTPLPLVAYPPPEQTVTPSGPVMQQVPTDVPAGWNCPTGQTYWHEPGGGGAGCTGGATHGSLPSIGQHDRGSG